MKLISLGANVNKLKIGSIECLFSYETLVGVTLSGTKYKTSTKYGRTTSKHINQNGYKDAIEIDQEQLNNLLMKDVAEIQANLIGLY